MPWTRVAGLVATAFGVLFLLYLFAWCSIQPPGLKGAAWWTSVLKAMNSSGAVMGTALGVLLVAGGMVLVFQRPRPRPSLVSLIIIACVAVLILLGVVLC